jgi:hypothetical protein
VDALHQYAPALDKLINEAQSIVCASQDGMREMFPQQLLCGRNVLRRNSWMIVFVWTRHIVAIIPWSDQSRK